ncbi:MAG: UDP-glucose/GDP-mannose dehydrogenase family protein [Armatimonadetes bacterium]|nr:UDP-glucose/GDP-mannose dehydrogenase family protein [Armatimonadota bacterium]
MKLAICGMGYVGSVTAACLAKAGHHVIGVDVSPEKVCMIQDGVSPVIEEGLPSLYEEGARTGRLTATLDLEAAVERSDATMVAVGTPSQPNGSLDTTALERVCEQLGRALRGRTRPHTLIVRSTVLPGTTRSLLIPILEEAAGKPCGEEMGVCYNPEFMREGTSVKDFYTPPFTVIGSTDDRHAAVARALYEGIDAPLECTSIEIAEMLKYSCNAFHALKIAFANEIGDFAAEHGVDGREVMRLLCLDRKLNISPAYLRPGFAFGGSCLPKDLRAMLYRARQQDLELPLLSSILPSNNAQLQRGLNMIMEDGRSRIALLGLTFKSGTDDLRESPYVELAETLLGKGYDVRIHDENVATARLVGANAAYINRRIPHLTRLLTSVEEAVEHAEIVVVCTGQPEYVDAISRCRPDQKVIDLLGLPKRETEPVCPVKGIAW